MDKHRIIKKTTYNRPGILFSDVKYLGEIAIEYTNFYGHPNLFHLRVIITDKRETDIL